MSVRLGKEEIRRLLNLLNDELGNAGILGEVHVVGGAVMCLALEARDSTRDVDALLKPTREVRAAAARVAAREGLDAHWLNDAAKGYLGKRPDFSPFLELPHLRVFVAEPHYLLAMKCAAMRLGEEFHDLGDVRYLLRHLDVRSASEALAIVTQYFDEKELQPKTHLILEELLGGS